MNDGDPPILTIDDDDPRYLQFLEEQAEDRRRWAGSPQARAEMEKLFLNPCADWKIAPKVTPLRYKFVTWPDS